MKLFCLSDGPILRARNSSAFYTKTLLSSLLGKMIEGQFSIGVRKSLNCLGTDIEIYDRLDQEEADSFPTHYRAGRHAHAQLALCFQVTTKLTGALFNVCYLFLQ